MLRYLARILLPILVVGALTAQMGGSVLAQTAGIIVSETGGNTVVSESGTTDTFSVSLNAQPTANVTVNLTENDLTEATVSPGSLTFTSTNWAQPDVVTVTGVADGIVDGNQASLVTLAVAAGSAPEYLSVANQTVTVTTLDIDSAGSLQFGAAAYSAGEGAGSASVTVTRTGGSSGAVGTTFSTSDGSANAPADYTATSGTVSFASGDSAAKTILIPMVDDSIVEGSETVNLTLTNPTGGATLGSPSSAVLTIVDNDPAPSAGSIQLGTSSYSVGEGAGSASISVTRTGGSAGAISAVLSTSDGSATGPADYTATAVTVTFANGDTATKTVAVPIVDDAMVEGSETINLTLSSPTGGATLGSPASAVLTILDNDPAPGPSTSNERPGWGCGDTNHTHTGPPGNPGANSPCDGHGARGHNKD